jgi:hypothetical protein
MTTIHSQRSFYAGDVWVINGSFYDRNHAPLDLTGASVEWALADASGVPVIDPGQVTVNITSVLTGKFTVTVPNSVTAGLSPGQYDDAARVTSATIPRETLWAGPIVVKRKPFPT